IVFAEILKGARNQEDFGRLREDMTRLPYLEATQETWITAGALSYQLRVRGVTVSLPDLVIASLAMEGDYEVYTLDNHFQRIPGLKLYNVVATG
ncbi:MAG: PIN domain-containing protein, partial [Chloroflexi bacterium]|nr:PIN domain-containing protein [Chloroflexota bacterium]